MPALRPRQLPAGLHVVRTTDVWDRRTTPAGLRRAHHVAPGVWGLLAVEEGRLRFRANTVPPLDVMVGPEAPQPIPPEVEHHVELGEDVRFVVQFLRP